MDPRFHLTVKPPAGNVGTDWMLNIKAATGEELSESIMAARAALRDTLGVELVGLVVAQEEPEQRPQPRNIRQEPQYHAREDSAPNDAWSDASDDAVPVCAKHHRDMRPSTKDDGYFCTATDDANRNGYCGHRWSPRRGFFQLGNEQPSRRRSA